MAYVNLTKESIEGEHICCAFSDKKCSEGYRLKKQWLAGEFDNGYIFRRLAERAKVFIEYGPAEKAWVPVTAPHYMVIGCFWVSGRYKGKGHGKALLKEVVREAKSQGKNGLVTVVGTKKFHFMSDTKWLLSQGFEICESISSGFSLISMDFKKTKNRPCFKDSVKSGTCSIKKGIVVYYSNRCPYSECYVKEPLVETANKRNLPLKVIKLGTMEQAQSAPTPATIFSLFLDGKFITTDIGVCMDSRFDKIVGKLQIHNIS
ncbi:MULTISPECIES: N-acetyltransferase [Prosthecochloris]|uniref:GNAT family N-acetyltransferase n=1 Tax=Prosthecochloris marina TaxID=2017681 RepID=A0A317T980_9CHLB|nr:MULTISPECIES: N-acetyltransferase [Prosthecochloris]PWW83309.1 GNAT family N-acetyltransferase [Prosthecochloris marina]UZJ36509.1 N-acetyltransferase [Prosthecochloris sp. SCSIO W1103]